VTTTWFDSRGCLSAAGLEAVRAAAPDPVAPELAQHIASCAACQDRLLGEGRPATRTAVEPPTGLQRWRLAIFAGGVMLMALIALWTMWRLAAGRPQ